MKKTHFFLLVLFLSIISIKCLAQPPYSGTIFVSSNIITSSDPSALKSIAYTGRGDRTVYDRRIPDWVTMNAYLFKVEWTDGMTSEAQVNPEFGSVEAAKVEVDKYALTIGQLPGCLRKDINGIWIHKGIQPFGGGNNAILIHTGQSAIYEAQGILEETLVHESTHTSLDAANAASAGWLAAQTSDKNFISTYARDNPTGEDVAESFLMWIAVRQNPLRISQQTFDAITKAIPNRISYFDKQSFNTHPLTTMLVTGLSNTSVNSFSVSQNSSYGTLSIKTSPGNELQSVEIYNMQGKLVFRSYSTDSIYNTMSTSNFDNGVYLLVAKAKDGQRYTGKWIKS
jgi:hypothetical protein